MASRLCQKCGRMRDDTLKFYTKKNGEKTALCKDCLTMHIDNFDPSTYLWILEDLDIPYVPEEWNKILDKAFAKDPNLTGMSVIGKYLSLMKLKQWKKYGWADTEKLQNENAERLANRSAEHMQYIQEIKQKYLDGEIPEAQYKTMMDTAELNKDYEQSILNAGGPVMAQKPGLPQYEFTDENEINDTSNLTKEDKVYLATKWGIKYTPIEWIQLEKSYNEMTESFDIQDADTINTLILICKTNLKMNQSVDAGDIEEYQKLSKISNDLRKSAKFTAAQNKEKQNDFINSIGELVAYCEKNGGIIPEYKIEVANDIVDEVIQDMKNYYRELIYEDKSLAKQIEDYLKKIEIAKQMEKDMEEAQKNGLDKPELKDKDYVDYQEKFEEDINKDKEAQENGAKRNIKYLDQ